MTLKEALEKGVALLDANNVLDAKIDAWYLLEYVTGISRARFILDQGNQIDELALYKYQDALYKRAQHIPLQHIIGEQEFMGMSFWVNENVLIPRQDTETLVEEALKVTPSGSHILDLCTGSGCVLISIIALGQGLSGIGVDISKEALVVAKENGLRLAPKAVFVEGDLFEAVNGKFNCIVSNPPYIRTADIEELEIEVKSHEPRLALDGSADGLSFYRRITKEAPNYLNEGGFLLFEIGYDQGEDVKRLMEENGFMDIAIVKDLAGHDRVVRGHI